MVHRYYVMKLLYIAITAPTITATAITSLKVMVAIVAIVAMLVATKLSAVVHRAQQWYRLTARIVIVARRQTLSHQRYTMMLATAVQIAIVVAQRQAHNQVEGEAVVVLLATTAIM